MNLKMLDREELQIAIIALLTALVLAANEVAYGGLVGVVGSYLYWIIRVLMESALFVAFLYALEKHAPAAALRWPLYGAAILISLIPFTLAITSFDLILGLPELGLSDGAGQTDIRLWAFAMELIYLLDNHVALCLLLLLPRLLWRDQPVNQLPVQTETPPDELAQVVTPSFFDTLQPPLDGRVSWIEAQEHYVRVTTDQESRMVLYRFSDAVREIPSDEGMQVHRSHWVAFAAVRALEKDGQNLKLRLSSDKFVPVSRSYRARVEEKFSSASLYT